MNENIRIKEILIAQKLRDSEELTEEELAYFIEMNARALKNLAKKDSLPD